MTESEGYINAFCSMSRRKCTGRGYQRASIPTQLQIYAKVCESCEARDRPEAVLFGVLSVFISPM
eukprot:scaffold3917_cov377-Prasinococcus_capsulatus_cf.AAC.5